MSSVRHLVSTSDLMKQLNCHLVDYCLRTIPLFRTHFKRSSVQCSLHPKWFRHKLSFCSSHTEKSHHCHKAMSQAVRFDYDRKVGLCPPMDPSGYLLQFREYEILQSNPICRISEPLQDEVSEKKFQTSPKVLEFDCLRGAYSRESKAWQLLFGQKGSVRKTSALNLHSIECSRQR